MPVRQQRDHQQFDAGFLTDNYAGDIVDNFLT
jgi:hypothetical protein